MLYKCLKQHGKGIRMIKIIRTTPKRITATTEGHEVIYNVREPEKSMCDCIAESFDTACRHKEDVMKHLIKNGHIKDKKMIEWLEREEGKL